jgi:hypothetical protein
MAILLSVSSMVLMRGGETTENCSQTAGMGGDERCHVGFETRSVETKEQGGNQLV